MKADYYHLNPNTRRKVILAKKQTKNTFMPISKKFQDENQNQAFTSCCKPAPPPGTPTTQQQFTNY